MRPGISGKVASWCSVVATTSEALLQVQPAMACRRVSCIISVWRADDLPADVRSFSKMMQRHEKLHQRPELCVISVQAASYLHHVASFL